MRFKTITSPNMEAAMAELRATMGPDAIILNTQKAPDGQIILRAALERAAPPASDQPANDHSDTAPPAAEQICETVLGEISKALGFHGVPAELNETLTHTVTALAAADPVTALAAAFDTHFGFAPLAKAPARPVMLIGPAGGGKTATAAKLAARALLDGHDAMLVTTDTMRTGATAQFLELAKIMDCPLHEAANPEELAQILGARDPATACFIDTPAASPFNQAELRSLKSLVMAADLDPVVVLPAGGDPAEANEIINIYSGFGARGMIITRLDATRRLGSILSAMETAAMTLHHVSITPYIAGGLAPISPNALARIFLHDPIEHETYQELEQAAQ